MPSKPAEVKDTIEEVEQPFRGSRGAYERSQLIEDIMFGRYDYAAELPAELKPYGVSVQPDQLRTYKDQQMASLRTDIGLHLEPVGAQKRAETAADKLEVMEAYTLMRLDPDGFLLDSLRYRQVVGLYFTGWLEEEACILPERKKGETEADHLKRVEQYKAQWFPWSLDKVSPTTTAYMEHNRTPTIATRRFRLPVIDLLERYGKSYDVHRENPEQALKIFREHFGWLAADEPQSEWGERELWTKDVEICAVDDGRTICHYADLSSDEGNNRLVRQKGDRYRGVAEVDYPNHFGRVSLLLAEGVYNDDQPIGYRREGLLTAAINMAHAKARLRTVLASQAMAPIVWGQELPSEISADQKGEPPILDEIVDASGRRRPAQYYGKMVQLKRDLDANMDKLFMDLNEDLRAAAPRGRSMEPDAADDVTATVAMIDIDEHDRLIAGAQKSTCNLFATVLDMIKHSRIHHLNAHRTKGEKEQEADWGASFTATGRERVIGKSIERGATFEVTAQDLDLECVRTVEPIDNRLSTQQARSQFAEYKRSIGAILYEDWAQAQGIENVTEFAKKKTTEQLYQLEATREIMRVREQVAEFVAIVNGTSVEEVLGGLPEEIVPQLVNAGSPDMAAGPMRMGSPTTEAAGGAPTASRGVV